MKLLDVVSQYDAMHSKIEPSRSQQSYEVVPRVSTPGLGQ